jgi:hypothetical protein
VNNFWLPGWPLIDSDEVAALEAITQLETPDTDPWR